MGLAFGNRRIWEVLYMLFSFSLFSSFYFFGGVYKRDAKLSRRTVRRNCVAQGDGLWGLHQCREEKSMGCKAFMVVKAFRHVKWDTWSYSSEETAVSFIVFESVWLP